MSDWPNIDIRPVRAAEVEQAYALEVDGYPSDEVDSYDKMVFRQRNAGDLFLGYFQDKKLIGYICATRWPATRLPVEAISNHDPFGDSVCIHSVCVHAGHRRKGIALNLLMTYIKHVTENVSGVRRMLLICKPLLIPLYTRAGFTLIGESDIKLGRTKWYDMMLDLNDRI